ncbi:hypothetical protein CONPUDRAFT_159055 [Coniophora puteana RWD-64-598 SS2]|uniref:Glucosamine 6-phosphate N-acetyltransferase n=1 Tax=Coniophora puteana (strain RWD-64-598) TaxID=741705 RepID=A0A5M3M9S1_CONPW|nr:uncharacterized protein CONPUDRAFT_159055 [Coniophora puteana RWD-64-598 SS2]EIW75604.1 hypothetical protein CONPUDRAFT_159055 [Coniophora puteana RWD-64-598 SS2]
MPTSRQPAEDTPLDLAFAQELISPEVTRTLPVGLTIRPLSSDDYSRGHLTVLSVLTMVKDLWAAAWAAQFHAIGSVPDTYYPLVIVDNTLDRILAAGTLFVERKFRHGTGSRRLVAVVTSQQRNRLGLRVAQALVHISGKAGCYKTVGNCVDANIRE